MQTGLDGLRVYEEVHQNYWNKLVHSIFLPGVFYAVFRGIPHLLPFEPMKTAAFIYAVYTTYYIYDIGVFSVFGSLMIAPYWVLAVVDMDRYTTHVVPSLLIAGLSLGIQEALGHLYFEEAASRLTPMYIFNAITYSPLFYMAHVPMYIYLVQLALTIVLIQI